MLKKYLASNRIYPLFEISIIILLAIVPLFASFPFRVNIFLSWEGAYRISEGQWPYADFGTPLGGMYWMIPALFMKIFGTAMVTLVKAQVFINILSGLAFRSILKSMGSTGMIRAAAVFLFVTSFSFFNFWPWYNHTVIVYEFIALAFLFKAIRPETKTGSQWIFIFLAALFTTCSFLTKQDAGAMAFLLGTLFLLYNAIVANQWKMLIAYVAGFIGFLSLYILPLPNDSFGYWFNHGQAPHTARVSLSEILIEFLRGSQWIKFYLFLVGILLLIRFKSWGELWKNKQEMLFLLLTIGILGEAAVFQVTSYTPPDNNIFFHSFAIAYILFQLNNLTLFNDKKIVMPLVILAGLFLWWSGGYLKYLQRIVPALNEKPSPTLSATGENLVNKKTYMILPADTGETEMTDWVDSKLASFQKIHMPGSTVAGIDRLLEMDLVKNNKDLRVLNFTELTPLAVEMPYKMEKGTHYPLWNHLGVGMFNKEAAYFEKRIVNKEYDLVLFEYIPTLNNFFPFRVRDTLLNNYIKIDSFAAPRRGDTKGTIEVFIKPTN